MIGKISYQKFVFNGGNTFNFKINSPSHFHDIFMSVWNSYTFHDLTENYGEYALSGKQLHTLLQRLNHRPLDGDEELFKIWLERELLKKGYNNSRLFYYVEYETPDRIIWKNVRIEECFGLTKLTVKFRTPFIYFQALLMEAVIDYVKAQYGINIPEGHTCRFYQETSTESREAKYVVTIEYPSRENSNS